MDHMLIAVALRSDLAIITYHPIFPLDGVRPDMARGRRAQPGLLRFAHRCRDVDGNDLHRLGRRWPG